MREMSSYCLHRLDDPSLGEERYARHRHPFSSLPLLRSHVHPHLVIYNLMDKLTCDMAAIMALNRKFGKDISRLMFNLHEIHKRWTNVQLPRRSRFHVNLRYAVCPGYHVDIDPDGQASWDIPGVREYKLPSSRRSKAILQELEDLGVSDSEGSTLGSSDSGTGGLEQFLHSLEEDQVWASEVRSWQASSAIAEPAYYEPWSEPDEYTSVPVRQSCIAKRETFIVTDYEHDTQQDEDDGGEDFSGYLSYESS